MRIHGKVIKVTKYKLGYVPTIKLKSIMKKTAKKSAKKKVATKKVEATKKEKASKVITRKNFPDKGWGFSKEQLDKIAAIGIKEGYGNLSQYIRAASEKAFNI